MFRKTEKVNERSEIRALPYVTKDIRELHKNEQRAKNGGGAPQVLKTPDEWLLLVMGVFMWYGLTICVLF